MNGQRPDAGGGIGMGTDVDEQGPAGAGVARGTTPVHTLFGTESVQRLDADHLSRVAAGVLGAVVVHGFFDQQECRATVEALRDENMGQYDEEVVGRRIRKLGPAVFDYYNDGAVTAEYWEHAEQARVVRSELLAGQDPLTLATARLEAAWPGRVCSATSTGSPLYAGMVREMVEGAGIHFDDVGREFPEGLDETPLSQLAFNCYLETPAGGGEVTVYRRRWRPADERRRDGYWYEPAIVEGEPQVTLRPRRGDAIVFDSRNFHMVEANYGGGRRVTLSFFIGPSCYGDLLIWS